MKKVVVDCPAYLELGLKNGTVCTVNGKELTAEGVEHVISYVGKEVNVKADDVFTKVKSLGKDSGSVTLKLYNGAVSTF